MQCSIPLSLLTDSYKLSHLYQYPSIKKMVAYGEFRTSFESDPDDFRLVFYGIRYIIETYIQKRWTLSDIEMTEKYLETHQANYTKFPWPKELFLKIVKECNGYFPVRIEAIPEGTVIYPHTPVVVITAQNEFAPLVTFLETLLNMLWYPSTVATLSRRCKDVIYEAFIKSVDESNFWLLESRLHDFGFRGCTSVEQAMVGGSAHLLNFTGTDTLVAGYHVQYHLNNGVPIGTSIPASEHSVMMSHRHERDAIIKLIDQFGSNIFAVVMDSYDYVSALENILPSIASLQINKGGMIVLRPDSGDPVDVVLMALRAADKSFGSTMNLLGYKVLKNASVIQGDGISYEQIKRILDRVLSEGYSAQNVAFGMGGHLLQRIHRDTCSFAIKLSHVVYSDSSQKDVMKAPKTGLRKYSLPGEFSVARASCHDESITPLIVYPKEVAPANSSNFLKIVYDHGPVHIEWEAFSVIRKRLEEQWTSLPKLIDPVSNELKEKIHGFIKGREDSKS